MTSIKKQVAVYVHRGYNNCLRKRIIIFSEAEHHVNVEFAFC